MSKAKASEEDTKKTNWAEMEDDEGEEEAKGDEEKKEDQKEEEQEPKKVIPPPMKGTKNKQGDYVVTTIDIPDTRDGIKKKKGN